MADIAKLSDYCLDPSHPLGKHKARVFAAALGLARKDAEILRGALLDAALREGASPGLADAYGQRYVVDFLMHGPSGRATVRSCWIVLNTEDFARLTTCYVLEGES